MNSRPHVSIIIINHRAETVLGECLAAIARSTYSGTRDIYVVDNPPDPAGRTGDIRPDLDIIRMPTARRIGFAAACNLAASRATGGHLLFLNPDVIVEPEAIDALYTGLTGHPGAGIAVGRLVGPDGTFQASCRRFPTLKNLVLSRGSVIGRLFGTGAYTLPDYAEITEVDAAAAAMMMIPRDLFEKAGGFDESFLLYMEDTDLCRRIRRLGYTTIYVPGASGRHYWGYSTGRYRFRRIVWHHRSLWRYFVKHDPSVVSQVLLAPALLVNCGLSLLIELFTLRR